MSRPRSGAPAEDHSSLLRVDTQHVAGSALWSALSTTVTAPVLIVTTVVLARILGPVGVGSIALFTFVTSLAGGLIDLGVSSSILRKGMIAAGRSDVSGVIRHVKSQTTWTLLQIPAVLAVGWFLLPSDDSIAIYAAGVLAAYACGAPSHFLVMTSQLKFASQARAASTLFASASTIAVAALTHRADLVFAVGILANNTSTAVQLLGVPASLRPRLFMPGPLELEWRDVTFGLGGLVNGQLMTIVFAQSETAFFRGWQKSDRGRYSIAQTVAARSTLILDSLMGPLNAGLVTALGRGDRSLQRAFRLSSDSIALLFLATCPLGMAAVSVLADPILGRSFHGIASFALVLTTMSLLQSASEPVAGLYTAQRRIRSLVIATAVSAVIDLGIAAICVHRFGVAGAVAAAVGGQTAYLVLLLVLVPPVADGRRLALRHMRRAASIVSYCVVPGVILLLIPRHLAWLVAGPLAAAWTLAGLRIGALRGAASMTEVSAHLPARVQSLLRRPHVLRLFGELRSSTPRTETGDDA